MAMIKAATCSSPAGSGNKERKQHALQSAQGQHGEVSGHPWYQNSPTCVTTLRKEAIKPVPATENHSL
jgi:hypothetical protein